MQINEKTSSRHFKVAEQIRKILAEIFQKGHFHSADLPGYITISEVQISPDLKNATIFVSPLGGTQNQKEFIDKIKLIIPEVKKLLAGKLQLRYCPNIYFKYDDLYDKANHMELLFKAIEHYDHEEV